MFPRLSITHAAFVVCTALAPPALAPPAAVGTAVRLSVAQMVERCDLCIEGRVTAARAILELGKRVDTEYTLAVERTFWGEPQASRAIRIPGGVLPNGSGMSIPGLPTLAIGEDSILFLSKPDAVGMRMPIGLAQGRMIVATGLSGRKRIVRDEVGLALATPTGGPDTHGVRIADEKAVLEYASTVAEIEAAAAARRVHSQPDASKRSGVEGERGGK